MMAISPAAALWTPPVTGASRVKTPFSAAIAARRWIVSVSLVLISIQVEPGARPDRRPSAPVSTRSETAGEGRQVIAASTDCASARGDSDQTAPWARSAFAALGSTSCT